MCGRVNRASRLSKVHVQKSVENPSFCFHPFFCPTRYYCKQRGNFLIWALSAVFFTLFTPTHGMLPSIWGPYLWDILFSSAWKCWCKGEGGKQLMANLENNLQHILPCKQCQEHFKRNMVKVNLNPTIVSMKKKEEFDKLPMFWLYSMKDLVNQSISPRTTYHHPSSTFSKRLNHSPISFDTLCAKLDVYGNCLSEVHAADTILVIAMYIHQLSPVRTPKNIDPPSPETSLIQFCNDIATSVPEPSGSLFVQQLGKLASPISLTSYDLYCKTRQEHGLSYQSLQELEKIQRVWNV